MALCAPDASYDQAIEELDKFTIDDLVKEIKAKIVERSANGIRGIARIFKMMDDKGDRKLDVDDFRWGLIDFGIKISQGEARQVLDHFDRDRDGYVNFDEFLVALRVSFP
jgi:Ca2+-binding EF-hand superfamily protein